MSLPLRINEMFAFVADNPEGEGVVAVTVNGTAMPLVGADMERIQSLLPVAQEVANKFKKPIRLIKLSVRTDLETFIPES